MVGGRRPRKAYVRWIGRPSQDRQPVRSGLPQLTHPAATTHGLDCDPTRGSRADHSVDAGFPHAHHRERSHPFGHARAGHVDLAWASRGGDAADLHLDPLTRIEYPEGGHRDVPTDGRWLPDAARSGILELGAHRSFPSAAISPSQLGGRVRLLSRIATRSIRAGPSSGSKLRTEKYRSTGTTPAKVASRRSISSGRPASACNSSGRLERRWSAASDTVKSYMATARPSRLAR